MTGEGRDGRVGENDAHLSGLASPSRSEGRHLLHDDTYKSRVLSLSLSLSLWFSVALRGMK